MKPARWLVTASPHLGSPESTPRIMWSVVLSLVPICVAGIYFFGPSALLVLLAATFGAVLTERIFGTRGTTRDGSAVITGLLLGLVLPAGIPLWMAFVGGLTATVMAGGHVIARLGYPTFFLAAAALTVIGSLVFWAYYRVPRGEYACQQVPEPPTSS